MSDKVEKRVTKNLLYYSCWSSSRVNKVIVRSNKSFLAQLGDQHESYNKFFVTLFSTLSDAKFS